MDPNCFSSFVFFTECGSRASFLPADEFFLLCVILFSPDERTEREAVRFLLDSDLQSVVTHWMWEDVQRKAAEIAPEPAATPHLWAVSAQLTCLSLISVTSDQLFSKLHLALKSRLGFTVQLHSPSQTPLAAGCGASLSPPTEPWRKKRFRVKTVPTAEADDG